MDGFYFPLNDLASAFTPSTAFDCFHRICESISHHHLLVPRGQYVNIRAASSNHGCPLQCPQFTHRDYLPKLYAQPAPGNVRVYVAKQSTKASEISQLHSPISSACLCKEGTLPLVKNESLRAPGKKGMKTQSASFFWAEKNERVFHDGWRSRRPSSYLVLFPCAL